MKCSKPGFREGSFDDPLLRKGAYNLTRPKPFQTESPFNTRSIKQNPRKPETSFIRAPILLNPLTEPETPRPNDPTPLEP